MRPTAEPHGPSLDVLYQDAHCIAVHKPSGLFVHRSELDRRADQYALQMVRDQLGQRVYPIHRLDRPTSGVLLFGLSPETARAFGGLFARRALRKTYLAVVRGWPTARAVEEAPLEPMRETRQRGRPAKPAQEARTVWRRLGTTAQPWQVSPRYAGSRYALLALRPCTGRRHQLRRHLAHRSHPIVGDYRHGDYRHNQYFREHLGSDRLLLHAAALAFPHPVTGAAVCIEAPLDAGFAALVERFGWSDAVPDRWLPGAFPANPPNPDGGAGVEETRG